MKKLFIIISLMLSGCSDDIYQNEICKIIRYETVNTPKVKGYKYTVDCNMHMGLTTIYSENLFDINKDIIVHLGTYDFKGGTK